MSISVILTEKEAAAYLGGEEIPLPVATLRYWRVVGRGPRFLKMGRAVRYRQDALDMFLEESSKQSTSETQSAA